MTICSHKFIVVIYLHIFISLFFRYGGDSFDISEIIESVFGSAKTNKEKDQVQKKDKFKFS